MRVLVACEYSARVRDAFRTYGHDAWSCDLLECEADPRWHYQAPVEDLLAKGWDLMIAHPPCTHLAVSGSRHFHRKQREQAEALDFVRLLMAAPIDRWCIENPVSVISTAISPPQQIIQPWQFGHGEVKATCIWLKNLPQLKPTQVVEGREAKVIRVWGVDEVAHKGWTPEQGYEPMIQMNTVTKREKDRLLKPLLLLAVPNDRFVAIENTE